MDSRTVERDWEDSFDEHRPDCANYVGRSRLYLVYLARLRAWPVRIQGAFLGM